MTEYFNGIYSEIKLIEVASALPLYPSLRLFFREIHVGYLATQYIPPEDYLQRSEHA